MFEIIQHLGNIDLQVSQRGNYHSGNSNANRPVIKSRSDAPDQYHFITCLDNANKVFTEAPQIHGNHKDTSKRD